MRHSTERSTTSSPEVVMTNDALLVISHAWPQHVPTHNGHGLPGCEPSQGLTLLSLFGRAGLTLARPYLSFLACASAVPLAILNVAGAETFEQQDVACRDGDFGIVFGREPPIVLRGLLA